MTAPTIIKWIEQGRVAAIRTAGGHRRVSHEALSRLAKECGLRLPPDSDLDPKDETRRILVFDLEIDFAEMVAEFLNLHGAMYAKSVDSLVDVGFSLGRFRPHVLLCTDEIGVTALGRVLHCADALDTRVIVATNGQARSFEALGVEIDQNDIVEKPLKLDALLKII